MKLLLHICCAPCLIYPLETLRAKGFEAIGLFYNPNIHPFSEYSNRRQAVEKLAAESNLEVLYPEYQIEDFFRQTYLNEEKNQRCCICWQIRLKKTAEIAKAKNLEVFTSTLLVSPYQDQTILKIIGEDLAKKTGLNFYYEDFRTGFTQAHKRAKDKGIYCQKYCGCLYSEIERDNRKTVLAT